MPASAARSFRVSRSTRAAGCATLEHLGDDFGVERRAAARDLSHRVDEARGLHDALLEEIADPGGAVAQ